jgi:hypothetical protein
MKAYSPAPGHDWNPLRRYRNIPCPCGSNRKAKHCHGRPETLPLGMIEKVKDYLRGLSAQGFIEVRKGEIQ